MNAIPADLNGAGSSECQGWYVMPRVEGTRCLLVASKYVVHMLLSNALRIVVCLTQVIVQGTNRSKGHKWECVKEVSVCIAKR